MLHDQTREICTSSSVSTLGHRFTHPHLGARSAERPLGITARVDLGIFINFPSSSFRPSTSHIRCN